MRRATRRASSARCGRLYGSSWRLAEQRPQRRARGERRAPPALLAAQERHALLLVRATCGRDRDANVRVAARLRGADRRRPMSLAHVADALGVVARFVAACVTSDSARTSSPNAGTSAPPSSASSWPAGADLDRRQRPTPKAPRQRVGPRLVALGEDVLADLLAQRATVVVDDSLGV